MLLKDASVHVLLGIPVLGTLGIVLCTKRQGYLTSASEVIRNLKAAGLYLDDNTISLALERSVGEAWKP
jgi:predicted nucleic acid-binding protein